MTGWRSRNSSGPGLGTLRGPESPTGAEVSIQPVEDLFPHEPPGRWIMDVVALVLKREEASGDALPAERCVGL
jgi:hypothetical protein